MSGTAEAGSTVTVTYPDGTTATVVAGTDGSWSVPNPGNLVDGDTVTAATATDPAGNSSLPVQAQSQQTSQHLWLRWMTC
ncbi:Ig-like domain-containing protein [Acinetobacter baumannii]|uniref:Ig-like domain-containing protein n=1 Tax=Acinetobacter baumannii TaxID=470 RepID=UPI003D2F0910